MALGVTRNIDANQLRQVAGKQENQFRVNDYNNLNRRLKNAITSQICEEKESGEEEEEEAPDPTAPGREQRGELGKYTVPCTKTIPTAN